MDECHGGGSFFVSLFSFSLLLLGIDVGIYVAIVLLNLMSISKLLLLLGFWKSGFVFVSDFAVVFYN